MKLRGLLFRITFTLMAGLPSVGRADFILWYNGDSGNAGATANEQATGGFVTTFDNFNVTAPGGWAIDKVWSNDYMTALGVTQAAWSIRSGMGIGNGGTILASGVSSATQTATGRSDLGGLGAEYTIQVTGLNVVLGPGTYWLSVSPLVGNDPVFNFGGVYKSYNSGTLGLNAVGTPAGNDQNGLFYDPRTNISPPANYVNYQNNYSMGVAGVTLAAVPEPSSLMLCGITGVAGLGVALARRWRAMNA